MQFAISDLTRLVNEGKVRFGSSAVCKERRVASNYNLKEYDKTIADYETVIKQFLITSGCPPGVIAVAGGSERCQAQ